LHVGLSHLHTQCRCTGGLIKTMKWNWLLDH
jgi:hypothetical protein